MSVDLRPPPRLPLDTAEYVAVQEATLNGFIVYEPGEPVYQISLLQTRTPQYFPSAWNRAVYKKALNHHFETQQEAEDAARPVLREFLKDDPRPPQTRLGKVLT